MRWSSSSVYSLAEACDVWWWQVQVIVEAVSRLPPRSNTSEGIQLTRYSRARQGLALTLLFGFWLAMRLSSYAHFLHPRLFLPPGVPGTPPMPDMQSLEAAQSPGDMNSLQLHYDSDDPDTATDGAPSRDASRSRSRRAPVTRGYTSSREPSPSSYRRARDPSASAQQSGAGPARRTTTTTRAASADYGTGDPSPGAIFRRRMQGTSGESKQGALGLYEDQEEADEDDDEASLASSDEDAAARQQLSAPDRARGRTRRG